jgi:hypothetical protein
MKFLKIAVLASLALMASAVHADSKHDKWVPILSMSSPVFKSVQQAESQLAKVGRTDTSTRAGRKASRLIAHGKRLQRQLMASKGKPMSQQQMGSLKALIMEMDQAAGKPASGSQGECFQSCDDAYGKGFGGGKGWNRFWCKASCFKINVNVGGNKSQDPVGSFSGVASNTAKPVPALKPQRAR